MTSHSTLPSAMLQAGRDGQFQDWKLMPCHYSLQLCSPKVLPLQNNRRTVELFCNWVFFTYLLLSAATVCLRPVCVCVLAWRVGMLLCHTTWSWCATYVVPLFLAWLRLAQWPADLVEAEETFPSLKPSAWSLVWSTRTMNLSEQKNMLVGNIMSFERVRCPHHVK